MPSTCQLGFAIPAAAIVAGLALFHPAAADAACTLTSPTTWTLGSSGSWTVDGNWTPATFPNSSSTNVCVVDGVSTVTLSTASASVDNLQVDSGNGITIFEGSLSVSGSQLINAGAITVSPGGGNSNLNIAGNNVTLSGGGTISLGGGGAIISGNNTLTNADNTIQGTGIIGNGGNLTVVNGGTIDANTSVGSLTLSDAGGTTNNNLLEATNGGTLAIATNVANTGGNITATGSGSTVALASNVTITGGTLNTSMGGVVETETSANATLNGVTISSGSTYTAPNSTTTNLVGTITNQGSIQLSATSGNSNLNIAGSNVTLNGGGIVSLSGGGAIISGNNILTNVDNTIQGTGVIGNGGNLAVVNGGTIDATPAGGTTTLTLSDAGGTTNSNGATGGLLEATNGGTLLIATNVANTGGNITATGSGSTVALGSNVTITGGTLNTSMGGVVETETSANATLNGVTISSGSTYTAPNSTTTNLVGTITNQGSIQLSATSGNSNLNIAGNNVTLNGGGIVSLSGGGAIISGNNILTNVDNTIQGTGIIGNGGNLSVVNGGTIDATPAGGTTTLTLSDAGGTTNSNGATGGLLEATNGGTLMIATNVANTGGNITATGSGSTVALASNVTITGGTLNTSTGGVIETPTSSNATLNGVTISSGSTYTVSNSSTTNLSGTIINQGTIQLNASGGSNSNLNTAGNVTLSGGGTVNLATASGSAGIMGGNNTLTNVDNTIQGTGIIGNGGNLAVVNGGTIDANSSAGTATLILNGTGGLTNNGTFAAQNGGILTATVPFTNAGTVHAISGTINANAGFTGTTGTAQIDAAGTLTIGANSTVGTLIHNGSGAASLNLSNNNITVSTDYTNGNFGTGNSFNKLANVATTGGQILAAGPTPANMQVITGSDVTGGNTATPTLALGNVHVGDSTTYQIASQGTAANPSLRGAIQTSVNGGNINSALLTGSGVTAANFGPLAPSSSTGPLTVTAADAGSFSGQAVHIANNFGNVPEQTMAITGAAYAYAQPALTSSLTPQLNFGVVQVGQTVHDPLTIANTLVAANPTFQEGLNASFGTPSTNFLSTNGGTITNLAAGQSNTGAMVVNLTPTSTGTISGTVPINFASNGTTTSGLGITTLAGQNLNYTWSFSGTVVNPANPSITPTSINFGNVHVGTTQQQALSVSNIAGTPPQASLDAQISAAGPATSNNGTISLLAPGATNNTSLVAGLSTANAGAQNGTATVVLQSDSTPNGCTSNCIVNLPSQTIAVTGNVYALASPTVTSSLSPQFNFGVVQVGQIVHDPLTITNTLVAANATFQEGLNASFGTPSTNFLSTNGGTITNLAAGQSNTGTMVVNLTPAGTGTVSGTVPINFASNGATTSGLGMTTLTGQNLNYTWSFSGTVVNPANPSITPTTINFGNVRIGTTQQQALSVTNIAGTPPQASLDAQISAAGPATSNNGTISLLAPGTTDNTSLVAGLSTANAGAQNGTATVVLQSDSTPNGCTSNCIVNLPSQTINVQGTVYRLANPVLNTPSVSVAARVGDAAASQAISITNSSPDTYTEGLKAAFGTASSPFSPSGSITNLAAQGTSTAMSVALATGTAGTFSGTAPVNFTSTGVGTDSAPDVSVGSGTVNLTGNVYTPAVATVLTSSPVNFGIAHVGDGGGSLARSTGVQNGATTTALNDVLTGTIGATGAASFSGSGTLGAGLGPGASSSALQVNLNINAAGQFTGTANLALASHDSQLADFPLSTSPLTLQAQVNLYAALAFLQQGGQGSLSGSGSSFVLDFGNVLQNTPEQALLAILNDNPLADQAFTDLLSTNGNGSMGPFSVAGCAVQDLSGGASQGGCDAFFDTSTLGTFMDSFAFPVESSNSSGYDQIIGSVTLTLQGAVMSSVPSVPEPGTMTLLGSGLGLLFFTFFTVRCLVAAGVRKPAQKQPSDSR
jgi:hypothetical protein